MAQHYTPIWDDWAEVTQELSAEEKGRLIDAIVAYDNGEDWQLMITGNERYVFPSYKARIDRWKELCDTRAENRRSKESNDNKTEQNETNDNKNNKTHKVKVKVKVKDINNISCSTQELDRMFDKFWTVYPRHEGKQNARKAFDKLHPDDALLEQMISAVLKQKQCDQWQDAKYIPHPATWLNGRRWEDEPTKGSAQRPRLLRAQDYKQREYNGAEMEKTLGVDDLYKEGAS